MSALERSIMILRRSYLLEVKRLSSFVSRISHKRNDSYSPMSDASRGMALVAALILLAVLSVMGATVLMATSTEIGISGNYRRGIEAFYQAEAGIAEGRARLRGDWASTPEIIHDPVINYDSRWSAYILTSSTWKRSDDQGYSGRYTNYIPLPGSPTNSAIIQNSLQTELPYWVKISHKTEYDAERDGHRPATPHYHDLDGSLRRHTRPNPGNVIVFGYPTADSAFPTEFTSSNPGHEFFPVERIVSSVKAQGGSATIEVDVVRPPAPNLVAAIYAKTGVSMEGPLTQVIGEDRCGQKAPKAPTYTYTPSLGTGLGSFHALSSLPQEGTLDIDLARLMNFYASGAMKVTENQESVNWGSSTEPMTVYVDVSTLSTPGRFTGGNISGHGILLIKGDAELNGPIQWQGLIISTGALTLNGRTGNLMIEGGILADQVMDIAGTINITYDSCAIKAALLSKPLIVTKWKQVL